MQALRSGTSVVLDIGLATRADRLKYFERCKSENLAYQFHYVTACLELRKARVMERNQHAIAQKGYVVSTEMFEYTNNLFEVPDTEELVMLGARSICNEEN